MTTRCPFHEFISSTIGQPHGNVGRKTCPQESLWKLVALCSFILRIWDFLWFSCILTRSWSYHSQRGFRWGCRRQHFPKILLSMQQKHLFFWHWSRQVSNHWRGPLIEFWWIWDHSNPRDFLCRRDTCSHRCLQCQVLHVWRWV